MSPLSSASKRRKRRRANKKEATSRDVLVACFLLDSSVAYSSTMKMDVI
jgi:hypothetical protein